MKDRISGWSQRWKEKAGNQTKFKQTGWMMERKAKPSHGTGLSGA